MVVMLWPRRHHAIDVSEDERMDKDGQSRTVSKKHCVIRGTSLTGVTAPHHPSTIDVNAMISALQTPSHLYDFVLFE